MVAESLLEVAEKHAAAEVAVLVRYMKHVCVEEYGTADEEQVASSMGTAAEELGAVFERYERVMTGFYGLGE